MLSTPRSRQYWILGVLLVIAFAILGLRSGWVGDDAFITLRTVDNALNGYGLRWNVVDRVQVYTHPLWMLLLLLVHGITGGPYYGTLFLGLTLSTVGVAIVYLNTRTVWMGLVATLPLLASKAYVDYATSGLENPLTHLLIAALFFSTTRGLGVSVGITSLLYLTRPDAVLIAIPVLMLQLARADRSRQTVVSVALGAAPFFAWEIFSLIYYGTLVPNTALAKLGLFVPRTDLIHQGLTYLWYAATFDRPTFLVLLCGLIPLFSSKNRYVIALIIGGYLHLAYVVWIGGDFMAGRFLTPAMYAFSLAIGTTNTKKIIAIPALGLVATSTYLNPHSPLWADADYERIKAWKGIADERGYYHHGGGYLATRRPVRHPFSRTGRKARRKEPHTVVRSAVGYFGYYAGPRVHVIDNLALTEPLLARLPEEYNPVWRPGHFRRAVPDGYDPTRRTLPSDPALTELASDVFVVTQDPIFSLTRMKAIAALLFHPPAVNPYPYRFHSMREHTPLDQLTGRVTSHGMVIRWRKPKPLAPKFAFTEGKPWQLLYGVGEEITERFDLVGTGALQELPPSNGPVDHLYLFPAERNRTRSILGAQLQ